jgi:Cu(I)/Ag(I) efflux system membrane fusion protein
MSASDSMPGSRNGQLRRSAWLAVRVLVVRLRFLFLLAGALLLAAFWPTLRTYWDHLTQPATAVGASAMPDTEFWCPMCPGVVSDWPGKCPVCNMLLVRRKKGEPAALPDGVIARMQLSPYRVQLAGIRTAAVDYQPLRRDIVMVGSVAQAEVPSAWVDTEVFETDRAYLVERQSVEAASDLLPGHLPFAGEVATIEPAPAPSGRAFRIRLKINDPNRELRPGTLVTARVAAPVTRLVWWRQAMAEAGRDRTAAELAARALLASVGPSVPSGVESLARRAVAEALQIQGFGLAVPHSAVIDHGSRKIAFVESGPRMFDAVEITVGPRCGDFYPVLRGLESGQRVAAAGAFLLDAEMWLNHGLAATYFGATRNPSVAPASPQPMPDQAPLATTDRLLAEQQKVCPVTGEPLDSMGGPIRVEIAGRVVFLCCKSCEAPLRKNPEKYLAKLPPAK